MASKNDMRKDSAPGAAGFAGAGQARLVSLDDRFHGLLFELSGDGQVIGRDAQADLLVEDNQVSRQHARISNSAGVWTLEDLNSSNGVQVNGKRVSMVALTDGDIVEFGALPFRFENELPAATVIVDSDGAGNVLDVNATMLAPAGTEHVPTMSATLMSQDEQFPGLAFALGAQTMCMGRDADTELHVEHKKISRKHAEFSYAQGNWWVEDLKSTNGVRINGEQIRKSMLRDGDQVQVGPVNFQFTVKVQQAGAAQGKAAVVEDEAGTMLFDDVRASEVLIKAIEEEQAQSQEPVAVPVAAPIVAKPMPASAPRAQAVAAAPAKKHVRRTMRPAPAAALGFVVALLILVYFLNAGHREKNAEISSSVARVQAILTGMEEDNVSVNSQQFLNQMNEIRDVSAQLNVVASHYPDDSSLAAAQAQLMFLGFERDLNRLMQASMVQEALDLVAEHEAKLQPLVVRSDVGAEQHKTIQDVADLLSLSAVMMRLSLFVQRFPDPVAGSERAPNMYDLKEAQHYKKEFIDKKKNGHLAISVTYPYFQRLVEKVDENSLRIINRWDELSRRQETGS